MQIIEPKSFLETFNHLAPSMGLNESVRRLERDYDSLFKVQSLLREMGLRQFVPLVKKSADAMISLPLYAGNGIVAKIIPQRYSDISRSVLFKLPPITVDTVEAEDTDFLIKTYPWISPRGVTRESVENMRQVLADLGLKFNENDDQPRNLHRLPDRNGTLISVDEDIYHGNQLDPVLSDAWLDYIYSIFPIYEEGTIPPQNDKTDYSFVSIHAPNAGQHHFTACRVVEVGYDFNM